MKKHYIAPEVTIVGFKMERGFLNSGPHNPDHLFFGLFMDNTQELPAGYDEQCQQEWDGINSSGSAFGDDWD